MKILTLMITLALAGFAQDDIPCTSNAVAYIAPEVASNTPSNLRFWRLHMDSAKGDWHLFNNEDKKFLDDVARRIASGQYKNTKLEWTKLTGQLPK